MRIIFTGDSITDVARNREESRRASSLGSGYPLISAASLLYSYPNANLEFFNTAMSGNTIADLLARWKRDVLNLNPDILVLLIGINDIWHEERAIGTDIEVYDEVFKIMLEQSYKHNPKLKIIILDPFWCGLVEDRPELPGKAEWKDKLNVMRSKIAKLASKFPVTNVIHTQEIFDNAMKIKGPLYWTDDSVHPSHAGHMLIAKAVIQELEKIIKE